MDIFNTNNMQAKHISCFVVQTRMNTSTTIVIRNELFTSVLSTNREGCCDGCDNGSIIGSTGCSDDGFINGDIEGTIVGDIDGLIVEGLIDGLTDGMVVSGGLLLANVTPLSHTDR